MGLNRHLGDRTGVPSDMSRQQQQPQLEQQRQQQNQQPWLAARRGPSPIAYPCPGQGGPCNNAGSLPRGPSNAGGMMSHGTRDTSRASAPPFTFEVVLLKREGVTLGIDDRGVTVANGTNRGADAADIGGLLIDRVSKGGVVDAWNQSSREM